MKLDLVGVVDVDSKALLGLVLDVDEEVLVVVSESLASWTDERELDLKTARGFVDLRDVVA